MGNPKEPHGASWLVVVPARLGSERLPKKPLVDLGGLPLIVRVARNLAPLAAAGARVVVAADDESIVSACRAHGVEAVMTRADHPSGTDRCAEVAAREQEGRPYVLNVQGDEPTVDTVDLMSLMAKMESAASGADMGTLVFAETDAKAALDPNAVKCVVSDAGFALYFSRAALPYDRARGGPSAKWWLHLGVYAFRRERLAAFVKLAPSTLETLEKLEQLRALENGWRILAHPARTRTRGIDTPEDLEAARARLK
jgi:3-deoxy-manno-octulosonate cytidylyltransferase (CMP-KDO synthetase)